MGAKQPQSWSCSISNKREGLLSRVRTFCEMLRSRDDTSLVLGSWWGLATEPLVAFGFAIRIRVEEKVLHEGLQGYADYARRVRCASFLSSGSSCGRRPEPRLSRGCLSEH